MSDTGFCKNGYCQTFADAHPGLFKFIQPEDVHTFVQPRLAGNEEWLRSPVIAARVSSLAMNCDCGRELDERSLSKKVG
jgi:hypothetical protein